MKLWSLCARFVLLAIFISSGSVHSAEFSRPLPRRIPSETLSPRTTRVSITTLPIAAAVPPTDPLYEKRVWMERASRILRNGKSLSPRDPITRWDTMSENDILDEWMGQRDFENSLLMFTLSYLGQRVSEIRRPDATFDGYDDKVFGSPVATHSVQEYFRGKDYFDALVSLRTPVYMRPLSKKLSDKLQNPGESVEAARTRRYAEIRGWFMDWRTLAADTNVTWDQYCATVLAGEKGIFSAAYGIGMDGTIVDNYFTYDFLLNPVQSACRGNTPIGFDRVRDTERTIQAFDWLFTQLAPFEPSTYTLNSILDLRTIDYSPIGGPAQQLAFTTTFEIFADKGNSSTNFNRKRSAYMLKTYFCDDLTPVGVEIPSSHSGGGRHGSDPSCFACHYKLDPMAGFFRGFGRWFFDYKNWDTLTFTDGAKIKMADYDQQWKAAPGTGRTYEVGYVRSTTNPSLNQYGESIADLEAILKSAPEVKSCFVRRLFEYSVGEDQSVSPGYLNYLTREFIRDRGSHGTTPNLALKNVWKKILTSESFKNGARVTNQCYDFAPGETADPSLPCEVSSLLQSRCVMCHSSAGPAAGLALDRQILLADGSTGFSHRDAAGNPVPRRETFSRIVQRLSHSDPARRMPLRMEIPTKERETLYLWADREAQK